MKAVIVFVKNPQLGKVKTRLAKSIGDEGALKVYKYLLKFTKDLIKKTNADQLFLYHYEEIIEVNKWTVLNCKNQLQSKGDLGNKMHSAFEYVFSKGFERVVVLGSDCLEVTPEIINNSFFILEQSDSVIGPAKDGGYYLLGLNKMIPEIFNHMPWSKSNLCEETIREIEANKLNYKLLPTLSDVDYIEDLDGKLDWKEL
jgi:rSAM/selenodomain-associated transferase 1